jgi:transcription initiation factor TFIIA large subunit
MPWDPPPPSVIPSPATVPSNAARTHSQSIPAVPITSTQPTPPSNNGAGGVQIKSEPGTGFNLQALSPGNMIPSYGNQTAIQRAGQKIQEKFGDAAQYQVNQLQQRAAMVAQASQGGVRPPTQPGPMPPTEDQRRQMEAHRVYAQQQAAQQQRQYQNLQQAQQAQQRVTAVKNAQTDGASDWQAMVEQRRADAQRNGSDPHEADMTIRQHLMQSSLEMEGGGLMLPLSQHPKVPASKKRRTGLSADAITDPTAGLHISQLDGRDDEDDDDKTGIKDDADDDEDAINSDLDDPDDNAVDETEDDEGAGEIMVCTYDKVQRVKNKWKCTLKDGVLTTGGREYVP